MCWLLLHVHHLKMELKLHAKLMWCPCPCSVVIRGMAVISPLLGTSLKTETLMFTA